MLSRRSFLALAPVAAVSQVLPEVANPYAALDVGAARVPDFERGMVDGIPLKGGRILLTGHPVSRFNGIWEVSPDGLYSRPRPTEAEC